MIDSHAHVAFEQFNGDREQVIERARQKNVRWLEIGTELESSRRALALAEKYPADVIGATIGVHPSDVSDLTDSHWRELEDLVANEKVVAVGEIGLDYFRGGTKEEQMPALTRFVELAVREVKPAIFHVRDGKKSAHDDLIDFLGHLAERDRPTGVIHTFSGNRQQAEKYLELGMYLSFSGVVTFKNAGEIVEVAREMPLEKMLLETDSPFLAPDPFRGKRNEPAYVKLVAAKIASLRSVAAQEIEKITEENTLELLGVG